jgi:hypothetical protein
MKLSISKRGWFLVGGMTALFVAVAIFGRPLISSAQAPVEKKAGQVDEEQLGNMLKAMGLRTKKEEQRYDFSFKSTYAGEEWELTMSTVLSQNGESIWLMAWLDPLPRSAADVPRTALLRLLADNDRLGKGKFFAYVASNRRFVLQRVIANSDITTAGFRDDLKDLGNSVVQTFPHWSVDNWKRASSTQTASGTQSDSRSSDNAPAGTSARPVRSTTNQSKFTTPKRN